jgi:hypothetical protein
MPLFNNQNQKAFAPPIACGYLLDESALRLHPKPLGAHAAVCTESAPNAAQSATIPRTRIHSPNT